MVDILLDRVRTSDPICIKSTASTTRVANVSPLSTKRLTYVLRTVSSSGVKPGSINVQSMRFVEVVDTWRYLCGIRTGVVLIGCKSSGVSFTSAVRVASSVSSPYCCRDVREGSVF